MRWLGVAGLALLGACTAVGNALDPQIEYKSQGTLPPLEVPPDLSAPPRDSRFQVPGSAQSATLSGYQAGRKETRVSTELLPAVPGMHIEQAGTERWLVVNEPAEKLWPLIKEFWQQNGFLIKTEVPEAGVMETDWAENRAKIPQGFIRETLGKVLDSAFSTSERDKFRTRLERTADGKGTEVYISHRGMEEVYTTSGENSSEGPGNTRWQPRDPDPGLEAAFLRRLMVRLGAREETAKAMLAAAPAEQRAEIVRTGDGAELLRVHEPFDRAWRRVGLALDRVGFTVEDRDRQQGLYFVRYADPEAEMDRKDDEKGFFSKLFGDDDAKVKATQYRIQVQARQGDSQVHVLTKDGAVAQSRTAERILALLHEQLK